MISKGSPNLEKILVSRKEITYSSCECLSGTTSIHFVKYSLVVKIKACPVEDGGFIGTINSKPHFEKGKSRRTGCKDMEFFPNKLLALFTRS
jgi:hypothetical protein